MRALLVQPRAPLTYWGFQHSLPLIARGATLPPLGAVTLAALLPKSWEIRVADLNLGPLSDEELLWADAVLVTGMLVHEESMHEVLARARKLDKRTVVGGPAVNTNPEAFPDADHVFRGEAEGRLEGMIRALEQPGPAPRLLSPPNERRPEMSESPIPRYDLLPVRRYASMSIQYSRGCPFRCEFCDIIEVFGRSPRVKSPEQVLAELEAIHELGYRGSVFFVDDNFIGNRKEVAKLLPVVADWQKRHGRPFELYTEASIDLASHPELARAMVQAGFSSVFVGLETPSPRSLREAGKLQNLRMDPAEAVRKLTATGLEVYAGFIVGFDSDGADIFEQQRSFIASLPIGLAMIGILMALPGTALWRRLERERRLRRRASGDQFDRPNFLPAMDERELLRGYRELLARVYEPEAYYRRCEKLVEELGPPPKGVPMRPGGLGALMRAAVHIGLFGARRRHFWKLLGRALRRPAVFARAVGLAIQGEHLIRYTREQVLPRLDRAIAELGPAPAASAPA
ncbi:MAG: B12-binding domain-containing radical SAM protein [Myxococcales bacterium]|nr:B12-binding domain-containing radical SAM protein [Myxococcales bacterium]